MCPRCSTEKPPEEFYRRRGKDGSSVYCKPCTNEQTIERQRKFKEQCVAYKRGKCERCGYDKYIGSLEFHHKDPTEKDFSVAHARLTSFSERVKRELDKCELLCSNCHREVHALLKGLI
jgi:5-methylcytosine-specific restriction endonuclease McrA